MRFFRCSSIFFHLQNSHKSPLFADNSNVILRTHRVEEKINESNWNRAPDRRSGKNCHSERDPSHSAYPRGQPVADNMDTVADFLLFHAGSGKKRLVEWYIMAEVVNFSCLRCQSSREAISCLFASLHSKIPSDNRKCIDIPVRQNRIRCK